jgi:hypothetical protein
MDLLADSAVRISALSVECAALPTAIITPNGPSACNEFTGEVKSG